MVTISSFSEITATSARINLAGSAADGTNDIQYASRPDFAFCVAPTFSAPVNSGFVMPGLNAGSVYYARVRARRGSGAIDPWSDVVPFRTLDGAARNTAPATVMIEPALIVLPEPFFVMSAAGTVAGYPPENLARDDGTAFRKQQNYVNVYFVDVQLSGAPIDTIALLMTNLPETATWYVQAGNVQINDASDVKFVTNAVQFRASPNLPQRAGFHGLIRLPTPQNYAWWRIVIENAPLPGQMLQAQHLIIGRNRVTRNHSVEKVEQPSPLTTIERKRSGIPDRVRGLPMRRVEFELSMLTEMQYETVYGDLWRYENEPTLILPNSKAGAFLHDRLLFGDLSGGRTVNPTSPRYTRQFAVNSII